MKKTTKLIIIVGIFLGLVACASGPREEITDYCYRRESETIFWELYIVSEGDTVVSLTDIFINDITGVEIEEYIEALEEMKERINAYHGISLDYRIEDNEFIRELVILTKEVSTEALLEIGLIDDAPEEGGDVSRIITLEMNKAKGYVCEEK